jgi:hypothetical protein
MSVYVTHKLAKLFYSSFHYREYVFLRYDNRFMKHTVYCLRAQFSDELVFIIVHHNHKHFSCDAEVFQHKSFHYFHNNFHLTEKNQYGAVRSDLEVDCHERNFVPEVKRRLKSETALTNYTLHPWCTLNCFKKQNTT